MTTTAAGRILASLALRSTMTIGGLVASRVSCCSAAAVRQLATAALVWVAFTTAFPTTLADQCWLTFVAAFTRVLSNVSVATVELVLATA